MCGASCISLFHERCWGHCGVQSRRLLGRAQDANARTFWLDLPRTNEPLKTDAVLPLRREDAVGTPQAESMERKHTQQGPLQSQRRWLRDQVRAKATPMPRKLMKEEVEHHNVTHVVFRNWCRRCVATRAREQPHHLARSECGTSKVKMDRMFFTSDDEIGFQVALLMFLDSASAAFAGTQYGARQSTNRASCGDSGDVGTHGHGFGCCSSRWHSATIRTTFPSEPMPSGSVHWSF